jgi:uncharacterized protein
MSNLDTVQQIYAAFGRGDVPAILGHLHESVEWEYGVNSTDVPWLQPRHGREGAGAFFVALSEIDIHRFAVKSAKRGRWRPLPRSGGGSRRGISSRAT